MVKLLHVKLSFNNSGNNMLEQSSDVTCELCSCIIFAKNEDSTKRFPVKFMHYSILCQTCYNSEKATIEQNAEKKTIMQDTLENIVSSRESFFNAERTDIGLIVGNNFERVIAIRDRINKWKDLLFEIRTRQESAQSMLQELAQNITSEERAKLKISDLNYQPTSTTPKPKVNRVSKEDKALLSMANTLFGRMILKGELTQEQAMEKAKEIVRNSKAITFTKMAEGSLKCTCRETPGICRVHGS